MVMIGIVVEVCGMQGILPHREERTVFASAFTHHDFNRCLLHPSRPLLACGRSVKIVSTAIVEIFEKKSIFGSLRYAANVSFLWHFILVDSREEICNHSTWTEEFHDMVSCEASAGRAISLVVENLKNLFEILVTSRWSSA